MNKLTLGLIGLGILILLVGADLGLRLPHNAKGLLGTTQSFPLHLVSNATALDQIFAWGGVENAGALWQTGALNASSSLTVAGASTLSGAVSLATTTLSGHLISGGGSPTLAVGGSGFSAGNILAGSNDIAGSVTGTIATANAGQLTINFGRAFASAPFCVAINANAASATDTLYVTSTASAMSINLPAGLTGGTHQYNYLCLQ